MIRMFKIFKKLKSLLSDKILAGLKKNLPEQQGRNNQALKNQSLNKQIKYIMHGQKINKRATIRRGISNQFLPS